MLKPYAILQHVTILHIGLTAHVFAILTATVKAGEFLQPWTSGLVKDYSDNINYAVGVNIIAEWSADFTNATIALTQDNNPGDAQGGPSVVLESKSQFYRSPTSRSSSPESVAESYNKTIGD